MRERDIGRGRREVERGGREGREGHIETDRQTEGEREIEREREREGGRANIGIGHVVNLMRKKNVLYKKQKNLTICRQSYNIRLINYTIYIA